MLKKKAGIPVVVLLASITGLYAQTMKHTGRTQAIVQENVVSIVNLGYNHEGGMTALKNGNVLVTWQAQHDEFAEFSFAQSNVFDGEKRWPYSRVANARSNNYTPVPHQVKKAGGPLKGWYVMSGSGGNRTYADVRISQDGKNWSSVLQLGKKDGRMKNYSELATQGLSQANDRKIHVTISGRGQKSLIHVVLYPDILVNNLQADNSGFAGIMGNYRFGTEASDAGSGPAKTSRD
ncbi:MAG: hypothetical protein GF398_09975 [Chitinivibrionales bacterium]|nr:hypothetical protein [Chitinivibrionales bacterium]